MVRAGNGFSVAGSALAPRVLWQTHPSVIRDPPQAAVPTARLGVAILARSSQPAGGWRPTARGHRTARRPRGFPPLPLGKRGSAIVDDPRARRFRETRSGAPISQSRPRLRLGSPSRESPLPWVHALSEGRRGLEDRHSAGRHLEGFAGLGVAARAGQIELPDRAAEGGFALGKPSTPPCSQHPAPKELTLG